MLIKPENLAVGDFSVAELRRAGRRLIDTGGEYASDEIRAWWDQLGRTAVDCAGMVMELVVTWRPHKESDKRFHQAAWRAMEACLPVFTFEEDDGLLSPQAASVLLQQLHTYTGLTASAVTSARSPHPLHEALVEKCDLLLLVARSAPFLAEANADAARALAARPEPFVPRSPVSWCAAGFSRRGSPSLVELPFVPANRDTGDDLYDGFYLEGEAECKRAGALQTMQCFEEAKAVYQRAVDAAERGGHDLLAGRIYNDFGTLFEALALPHFNECLRLREQGKEWTPRPLAKRIEDDQFSAQQAKDLNDHLRCAVRCWEIHVRAYGRVGSHEVSIAAR